jgi:hypothetical protein
MTKILDAESTIRPGDTQGKLIWIGPVGKHHDHRSFAVTEPCSAL